MNLYSKKETYSRNKSSHSVGIFKLWAFSFLRHKISNNGTCGCSLTWPFVWPGTSWNSFAKLSVCFIGRSAQTLSTKNRSWDQPDTSERHTDKITLALQLCERFWGRWKNIPKLSDLFSRRAKINRASASVLQRAFFGKYWMCGEISSRVVLISKNNS